MTSNKKRIVIIGATSTIAEHCARIWVRDELVDLTLVGRDLDKTERVAADLRVRSPKSVIRALTTNFIDPKSIQQLVDGIVINGALDIVLIAHGSLPDQDACQKNLSLCNDVLTVNAISPVLYAEAFAGYMQKINHGTLAIIGSVAGDRGRKSNYVYGSAKGLLTRYTQGLQHRLAHSNVKVTLVKPGPTNTPMTAHLQQNESKFANVEDVASSIVSGVAKGVSVVYAPAKWALIMMIIRHLPEFIFKKMDI